MKTPHVLCIGSAGKDVFFPTDAGTIARSDTHHDEVQWGFSYGTKIHIENRFEALGGCACNVSVGLVRLGIDTTVWGVVGHDADGSWISESLLREGVDVEHLTMTQELTTDLAMILVHQTHGERIIFVNRDAGEHLALDAREVGWYKWVYVGSLYGEHCLENMRIVHHVSTQKTKLIYNPGMHNITHHTQMMDDLLHHAWMVFCNKKEAREILLQNGASRGEVEAYDEPTLIQHLAQRAPHSRAIVMTYGKKGAWVWHKKHIWYSPSEDAETCDTTGAGDAFASGFLAAQLHGEDIAQSLAWGAYNSQSVIKFYGGQKGLVTRAQMRTMQNTIPIKKVV